MTTTIVMAVLDQHFLIMCSTRLVAITRHTPGTSGYGLPGMYEFTGFKPIDHHNKVAGTYRGSTSMT